MKEIPHYYLAYPHAIFNHIKNLIHEGKLLDISNYFMIMNFKSGTNYTRMGKWTDYFEDSMQFLKKFFSLGT